MLDCDCSISCGVGVGSCGTGWDWGRCQHLHSSPAVGAAVVRCCLWQYLMMCWQCPRSVRGASSARRCMSVGLRCWTSPRPRHRCPLAREAMNLAGKKGKFRWIKDWVVRNGKWRTGTGRPGGRQVVTQWHRWKGMSWRRWRWVMSCGNFPRRYLRFLFSFLIISLCGRIIISISVCCDCDGCDRGRRDMTFGFLICPGTNRNPDQWQCAKKDVESNDETTCT